MPFALRTEGLSKRYPIGQRARYGRLTESLSSALARAFRRTRAGSAADETRFIWALRDVSLEVEQGEVLGIIGRNGAGKSTLLKILAGITWPTEGEAEIRGRVGSLLEVGTGFHPELTGRENVYLNGAILGMRKAEIDRKFDEIVEFAEITPFLDTAVKHYSSGMRVRLAFSVAAYLDSEILLVDEVLAVGDYRFQRKCLQTMRQVGETGDTVLFVSHNFAAVQTFCTSCVWIDDGRIVKVGGVDECIKSYTQAYSASATQLDVDVSEAERPPGQGSALRFTRVRLRPDHEDGALRHTEPIRIELEFIVKRTIKDIAIGFSIYSMDGTWVFQCLNTHSGPPYGELVPGSYLVEAEVNENILLEGRYALGIGARSSSEALDWVREPLEFDVAEQSRPSWWGDPAGAAGIVRPTSRFATPRRTERVVDQGRPLRPAVGTDRPGSLK